ncbi:hypothetical protein PIB30_095370, partial [Stylosanthes scabra]|nr:hypothetical protein [Stylosanthes scabra]
MGDDSRLIMEEDEDFRSLDNPSSSLIPSLTMHFSSLMIDDVVDDRSRIVSTKTFSYTRLPSEPFTISVLKLDGSCFYVEVAKTATVADLNRAVEAVFSHIPQKWTGEISWAHVWEQFCLCYEGRKLVTETAYLRDYGIKDGDQLRFIRRVPNPCSFQRKRSKKRIVILKMNRRYRSSSKENRYQQKVQCGGDDDIGLDEEYLVDNKRLTGFLGGLFSCNRLAVAERARTESRVCPSAIAE